MKNVSANSLRRLKDLGQEEALRCFSQFKESQQKCLSKEKVAKIKSIYQHGVCGQSRSGHLVVFDRISNIKLVELWKTVDEDDLVAYVNLRLLQITEQLLSENQSVYWIFDVGGKILQFAAKKNLEVILRIVKNANSFFPSLLAKYSFALHRIVFVNTPMLFDTLFDKIAPYLSPRTLKNIIRLEDDLEPLYLEVPPAILPYCLGGERRDDFFFRMEEEESSSEEEEYDFTLLRKAFGDKVVTKNQGLSVLETPLNTEADDE